MMNCNNCNIAINTKYCPNCGQPAALKKIDGHYIIHEIGHVLHFEGGLLYTIKELMINPGQNVRTYLTKNRNRLVKPIIFIIITSLIYSVLNNFFHIEDEYVNYNFPGETATSSIFKWIQEHYGYANIIMGVFIALWAKLFFRKSPFNIFEILILLCFIMGMAMLIYSVFAIIQGLTNTNLMQIAGILGILYSAWAIGDFFIGRKVVSYIKALLAYLLGMLTFSLTAIILGVIIDLLKR